MASAAIVLLLVSVIIFVGFLAKILFRITNVPDVIALLVLGIIISQIGIISREMLLGALPLISAIALALILFEAGLDINLADLIENAPRGVLLSAVALLIATLGIGFIASPLLGISLPLGLLLGAILGGVSSPLVISFLEGVEADEEVETTLTIESIITDPLVIVVSLAIMGVIAGTATATNVLRDVFGAFTLSIAIGVVAGIAWLFSLHRIGEALEGGRFKYILTLGFLFLVYAFAELFQGSGAVTSFVLGIMLANGGKVSNAFNFSKPVFSLPEETKRFHEEIAFFIKTFFFFTLGAIISFAKPVLFFYGLLFTALAAAFRIIAVDLVTWKMDFSRRQKSIMYVMMPRGLAAAIVASLALSRYAVDGIVAFQPAQQFPEITLSVIFGTVILSAIGSYLYEKLEGKEAEIEVESETEEEAAVEIEEAAEGEDLDALQENVSTLRDEAIVALLQTTGMQVSEVVLLDRDDVGEEIMLGEGEEKRSFYPSEKALELVERYLDQREDDRAALFVEEETRQRISEDTVRDMVREAAS